MNGLDFDTIDSNKTANNGKRNMIIKKWGILQRVVFIARHFKSFLLLRLSEPWNVGSQIRNIQGEAYSPISSPRKIGDVVGIKSR